LIICIGFHYIIKKTNKKHDKVASENRQFTNEGEIGVINTHFEHLPLMTANNYQKQSGQHDCGTLPTIATGCAWYYSTRRIPSTIDRTTRFVLDSQVMPLRCGREGEILGSRKTRHEPQTKILVRGGNNSHDGLRRFPASNQGLSLND
jgi:hypothetical protein